MHRRAVLLVALLFAIPLLAQSSHLVSKIDVRGNVPAKIVLSQTALEEGRSYSDADLEIAVSRLRRLDFVFDARYAIEGETLVIEVDAVRRLFAEVGADGYGYDGDETATAAVGGGGRLLLASGGVAEARVSELVAEGEDLTFAEAAYSQYGIGGTRLFATAGVSQSFRNEQGFDPDPTWRLVAGYPLTLRQTITGAVTDEGYSSSRIVFPFYSAPLTTSAERRTYELRWTWDTSDDPYFARHGLTINAGPAWSEDSVQFDGLVIGVPGDFVPVVFRSETNVQAIGADARKFWATGTRGTLLAGLAADRTEFEGRSTQVGLPFEMSFDATSTSAAITAGYAHNLFDWSARTAVRQRVELGATYSRSEIQQMSQDFTTDGTNVNAAYVLRHPYATVRLNLSYAFDSNLPAAQQPAEPFRR